MRFCAEIKRPNNTAIKKVFFICSSIPLALSVHEPLTLVTSKIRLLSFYRNEVKSRQEVVLKAHKDCYCAFCKTPRRIFNKKMLSFSNYFQAFGLAAVTSYLFWQELDPRGLIIAIFFLILIEITHLVRSWVAVSCPHCGFDPALYIRNQAAACERVKGHLARRQEDPDVWLARKPPLRFAHRIIPSKNKKSTREIVA